MAGGWEGREARGGGEKAGRGLEGREGGGWGAGVGSVLGVVVEGAAVEGAEGEEGRGKWR